MSQIPTAATATDTPVLLQRRLEQFQRDNARVIARYHGPQGRDAQGISLLLRRLLDLPREQRQQEWQLTFTRFASRHRGFKPTLRRYFARLVTWLESVGEFGIATELSNLCEIDQLLAATYVTAEYSVESAAFFNPSVVPHPSQGHLAPGELRFIMSFRATGEGHISSVAFRTGVLNSDGHIRLDPVSPFISTPTVETHRRYDKALFARKLQELHSWNAYTELALGQLTDHFTRQDMEQTMAGLPATLDGANRDNAIHAMRWLAEANYTVTFDDDEDICEHVIFPVSSVEAHGIEDARFVRFVEDDGTATYYATYTAFSGHAAAIQLIETADFRSFNICTLNGPGIRDKGMALFPRRINGDYVMLGRQDSRSITLSRSRDLHFWHEYQPILEPRESWELMKIGNCGSPIETPDGWIILTHGVGPIRRYCIGAALLDLNDPSHVIGRLRAPLIEPLESEREGYVPNVVYTCGAILHRDILLIPYAMSDTRSGIAVCNVHALLESLHRDGP